MHVTVRLAAGPAGAPVTDASIPLRWGALSRSQASHVPARTTVPACARARRRGRPHHRGAPRAGLEPALQRNRAVRGHRDAASRRHRYRASPRSKPDTRRWPAAERGTSAQEPPCRTGVPMRERRAGPRSPPSPARRDPQAARHRARRRRLPGRGADHHPGLSLAHPAPGTHPPRPGPFEPPAQLRLRTVTVAQPADHPETVSATA